jgi:hypothetical protein
MSSEAIKHISDASFESDVLKSAGLLLLLKTFQRLGYFAACAEIPAPIIRHVFRYAALADLPEQLQAYDASTARDRHAALIREFSA